MFATAGGAFFKSSLCSLNSLSGVTNERCAPRIIVPGGQGPYFKVAAVASRWQRVEDLIGSKFQPHIFRSRSGGRTTCAILTGAC